MTHATPAARTIAAGGNPTDSRTFTHKIHGDITFSWRLPLAIDSLRHSVEMDNLLQELSPDAEPSYQTRTLAAALAGLAVPDGAPAGKALMLDLPVVKRTPDPDDAGRVHVEYYDAATEADIPFLGDVWEAFAIWRHLQMSDDTVEAVGKSSGATSTPSDGSSTPSAEGTAPPALTPAS